MNDHDVLVLGEVLWDHVGTSKKTAGAPLNFARHLKRQGMVPYLVSAVGLDEAGIELVRAIEREGILHSIPVVGAATGRADVVQLPEGKNQFELKTPAAWDFIPLQEEMVEAAEKAAAVYFGTLAQRAETSRETLRELVSSFAGKMRILDVNLRPPFDDVENLRWCMRHCDILKFSIEEIDALSHVLFRARIDDPTIIIQACMERFGIQTVVETLGEFGARVWTADGGYTYAKAPKVEVVSTVGAGDAFLAAFVAALMKDIPVETALRMAVAYAAEVISHNE